MVQYLLTHKVVYLFRMVLTKTKYATSVCIGFGEVIVSQHSDGDQLHSTPPSNEISRILICFARLPLVNVMLPAATRAHKHQRSDGAFP